mgnify:CR=1 FL=1
MATEKKINTRIQLKYSTLAEWSDLSAEGKGGNLVLKSGEVGIVAIPKDSTHLQTTPPAIMFKVGDGTTAFKDLPWASALAADVYGWAKKSVPTVADFGDIIAAARDGLISADSVVKTLNGLKGNVTIAAAADETHITVSKNGQTITLALTLSDAEKAALSSGITSAKVKTYDGYDTKIAAAQSKADAALPEATFNSFKTENTTAIAEAKKAGTDAASALSTYKTSNDTAVAKKVDNTITVNGHPLSANVTVSKSDVGLGSVVNKGLDTAVTASSGNYITSGAVKTAIDNAISGVTQFDIAKYDSFDKLPTTGKKGVIYIVAHAHSDSNDSYDEYIWNTALTTPAYEKIGNTDVNLSNYVNTLSGTANSGVITNISKSGNTITVTSKSLATEDPAVNGSSTFFIDSISQAADGQISATKKSIPVVSTAMAGLMGSADKTKLNGIAEGATKVTDSTVSGWGYIKSYTDTNQKVKVGTTTFGADATVEIKGETNVTVSGSATDGTITIKGKSDTDINTLIDNKINNLDVSTITGFGAGKTLKTLTETNGKIAATFQDISITASQVSDFNAKVDARINNHTGVDKVGTVTSVSTPTGSGLKVTNGSTTPSITIDPDVVFVFDCGSATVNV